MQWKTCSEEIVREALEEQPNIELKARDGSVKAHKVVLAAASPFFKALFSSNFKENTENAIDLSATFSTASCLKEVINHIYGMEIELDEDNIETCLCASCFFLLTNLTKQCLTFLFQNLKPSNCLLFWDLAFSFDFHMLIKACRKMAADNFKTHLAVDESLLHVAPETLVKYLRDGITKYCTKDDVKTFIDKYLSYNKLNYSQVKELSQICNLQSYELNTSESETRSLHDVIVWPYTKDGAYYIYQLVTNQWYKTPDYCLPEGMKCIKVGVGVKCDQILMASGRRIFLANMKDPHGTIEELPDPKVHLTEIISERGGIQTENEDFNEIKYFVLRGDLYCIGSVMNDNYEYEYFIISKLTGNNWKFMDCYRTTGFVSMDKVSVCSGENHAFIMIDKGKRIRVLCFNPKKAKIEMFQLVNQHTVAKQGRLCYSEGYVYLLFDNLLIKSGGLDSPWETVEEFLPVTCFHIKTGSSEPNMYAVCGDKELFRYSLTDKELIPLKSAPVVKSKPGKNELTSLAVEKVPHELIQLLIPLE